MLGVIGSALGIVLGRLLAAALLGMISDTVNALFTTSTPGPIALSPASILAALFTGTAVAFFSALIPAREAARVAPAEAMRRSVVEHETRLHIRRDLVIAAGRRHRRGDPLPVRTDRRTARPRLRRHSVRGRRNRHGRAGIRHRRDLRPCARHLKRIAGAAGLIAGRSLVASLARTSIVVTALATAISMMISVGVMVGSFRETVAGLARQPTSRRHLHARRRARHRRHLSAHRRAGRGDRRGRPPASPKSILCRAFEFRYEGTQSDVRRGQHGYRSPPPIPSIPVGNANDSRVAARSDRAIVTEPFADKHHVHIGDVMHIPLGTRTAALTVAGIYYDYSSDRGTVLVDRSTLLKYLPDQPVTNIAVYVQPGADATKVRRDLESRLRDFPLMIAPNEVLRRAAVEVFDRTFAVTYALEAVAIVVAMLGAANSLLALVLDRRREIGLIRYLGAATGQVRRMILMEAGLLGLLAGSLGLALGMALSLVLIYVVNKQSFGWTIQFHPPVLLLAGALLLVWAVTVLAGVYPARFAARLQPADVIHEE